MPHPDNEQMVEEYVWAVRYEDGSTLEEYPTPTEHVSFGTVAVGQVVELVLMPNDWLGVMGPAYIVTCDPWSTLRPVFFRRNAINVNTGLHLGRMTIFGTQQTVNGRNVKSLMHRVEWGDGSIVLAPVDLDFPDPAEGAQDA